MKTNSLLKFSNASSIFCLLIVLFACASKKNENSIKLTSKGDVERKNYLVLDGLKNLDFIDKMKIKDYYKQNFEPLNDELKIKYLSNFFIDETGQPFSKKMLTTDVKAFLIASLYISSFFKPTIIKIYGKKYTALVLVNINRYGSPLSGETLYYYKLTNPQISNDTLIVTQPKYKFDIKLKGRVVVYEKTIGSIIINPKTKKKDYFIDKTICETKCDDSGMSYTNILEESRISQKFEIKDFQSY